MDSDKSGSTVTSEIFRQALPLFVRDFRACDSLITFLEARKEPLINDADKDDLSECRPHRRKHIAKLFDILRATPHSEEVVIQFLKGPQRSTQPQLIKELEDLKIRELEKRGLLPDSEAEVSEDLGLSTSDDVGHTQYLITNDKVVVLLDLIAKDETAISDWINVVNRMDISALSKTKVSGLLTKNVEQAIRESLILYVREKNNPPLENFLKVLTDSRLNRLAGEIRGKQRAIWK